ncbi:MAG: hypothetical protein GXO07_06085 [Crenarchaeota archaeon]|nr:hypothetical protein [Thermoproteota archaeon]
MSVVQQEKSESYQKVASVLGAAYGLKILSKIGGATPAHIENAISVALRATTLSDIASYLEYQVARLKKEKKEKKGRESPEDYQALLELLNALKDNLGLERLEKDKWRYLVLKAFLNFKRVCSKVEIDTECVSKCDDIKEVIEMIDKFDENKVDTLDAKIVSALKCIVDKLNEEKCKPQKEKGGRRGRPYGR